MGHPDIWTLAGNFGFGGLLLCFVVWKETNDRKDRMKIEEDHAAFRREQLEAIKDETESRNKLATSLSALVTVVTGRPHV